MQAKIPSPAYCQYSAGQCDQALRTGSGNSALFLYASNPELIASTIESAADKLRKKRLDWNIRSWKQLPISGQIVFCEVCKAIRASSVVIADVSTLNFNLLFEIGFCIGLGAPLIPIRDSSYEKHKRDFEELGILDTLGYVDFSNSQDLANSLETRIPGAALPSPAGPVRRDQPIFIVKGAIQTEGEVQLLATVRKSKLRYTAHDSIETPRVSLHDARRSVHRALGVIAHLQSAHRRGHEVHNARAALIAGIAMAQEKTLLMLQEEHQTQPLDYRDVVRSYSSVDMVPPIVDGFLRSVIDKLQDTDEFASHTPVGLLERLDLGDPAAENEIRGLRSYFVRTGPYAVARQGSTPLVVGMKGSGKTALFYGIRDSIGHAHSRFLLDLKPEGHQFKTLREVALSKMSDGVRQHTIAAFWTHILLCELAHKIRAEDIDYSRQDPTREHRYAELVEAYAPHDLGREADFSQRLLKQVDRVAANLTETGIPIAGGKLTELFYGGDIHRLSRAVGNYLAERDEVWILVDNIDKGWPTRGTSSEEIGIIRGLLESTRKLKRELAKFEVDVKYLVFVRTDIYEHLIKEAPDKGKDTCVRIDWSDREAFKSVYAARVQRSLTEKRTFDEYWKLLFSSHVGTVESFEYIIDRVLMRPRHFIQFLRQAIQVAINRGHSRVLSEDVIQAERNYSEDLLLLTGFEIEDAHPHLRDVLYQFHGSASALDYEDAILLLLEGVAHDDAEAAHALELLVWYGFLGVRTSAAEVEKYAYDVQANVRHLMAEARRPGAKFAINAAFRSALGVGSAVA